MSNDAAPQPTPSPQLTRAVTAWLGHLRIERGRSANTLAAYQRDIDRYLSWLASREITGLDQVNSGDLASYQQDLSRGVAGAPGLSASSVARNLAAVRGLHRFAAADGLVGDDVSARIAVPSVGRRLPKALSIAQVQSLLDNCDLSTVEGLLTRALLELLYGTGARISEITNLDVDDLTGVLADPDAGLRLFGKGSKERIVPLGSYAREAVDAWLVRGRPAWAQRSVSTSQGRGNPALLLNQRGGRLSRQSAWALLQSAGERAGVEHLGPHSLRHSYATHLLEGGADVRVVQELLGHASVTTTQIYTLVTVDHLRDVYRSAHPRARG